MQKSNQTSRRKFLKQSALAGAGLMLARSPKLFSQPQLNPKNSSLIATTNSSNGNIRSKGYAGFDTSGKLRPWNFERRAVGDNDILINVKYSSICHSDIHTIKGDWGQQAYPQVPGHEIVGVVAAVGKNVTKFKVGDRAGVGCMVDSCMVCESCKKGEEQHCDRGETVWTYGFPDRTSPTGITQGGYADNIVVRDHFAVHIPENISFQEAAPLLCAGITTYSPLMNANIKRGDKVGVSGIGGLGHLAVKLAVSRGAEVYAFTTSPDKADDIRSWGAKEVVVVDENLTQLAKYKGVLDYHISTIPYAFNLGAYAATVKPYGYFTLVGMPVDFSMMVNNNALSQSRVNYNASLIGGIPETQEVVNYCASNQILPKIEIIRADQINEAWENVVNKKARYRYVIDAATF